MISRIRARPLGFTPQRTIDPSLGQNSSAALRELGDASFQSALQIYRDQNRKIDTDSAHRAARIEAVKQLGKARVDFDNDPDVTGLGERFDTRAAEIRASIADRFGDDEAAIERFNTDFEAVFAPHAVGVYRRQTEVRQKADIESLEGDLNDLLEAFGTATDDASRGAIQDQAAGILSRARDAGLISDSELKTGMDKFARNAVEAQILGLLREDPAALKRMLESGALPDIGPVQAQQYLTRAEAELERRRVAGEVDARRAATATEKAEREAQQAQEHDEVALLIRGMDDDPARLVDRIDAGEFPALAASRPDTLARYRVLALSEVDREARALVKANEDLADARLDGLTDQVEHAEDAMRAGRPSGVSFELITATRGTPLEGRVDSLIDLESSLGGFREGTPDERREKIEAIRKTAPTNEVEIFGLELMEDIDETLKKSEQTDIVGHHATVLNRPMTPVEFGDPATLLLRHNEASRAAAKFGVKFRYFSEEELNHVAGQIADGDPDSQLALIMSLTTALGDKAEDPLSELGLKDPVFGHAGHLALWSGDPTVARTMLAGRAALKDGTAKKPTQTVRDQAVLKLRAFEAIPARRSKARSELIQAANMHYAATAQEAKFDITDESNSEELAELYERSLQLVAGARFEGDVQYGGIQQVGFLATLLPRELTADEVETALEDVTAEILMQASLTGERPSFAGGPMPDVLTRTVSIQHEAGGTYLVGHVRNGVFEALGDDTLAGAPAQFDLHALVRAARRARR